MTEIKRIAGGPMWLGRVAGVRTTCSRNCALVYKDGELDEVDHTRRCEAEWKAANRATDAKRMPTEFRLIRRGVQERVFFRVYQDRESMRGITMVVSADQVPEILAEWLERQAEAEDELAPVFEPVVMTPVEFAQLPEFAGF